MLFLFFIFCISLPGRCTLKIKLCLTFVDSHFNLRIYCIIIWHVWIYIHTCMNPTGLTPWLMTFSARGNRRVWEGDCATSGPGKVDGTGPVGMGQRSEGGASQTLGAPRAGDQREARGPPLLQGEHPDQRAQLQGCSKGAGESRWAPAASGLLGPTSGIPQCSHNPCVVVLYVYVFGFFVLHKSDHVYFSFTWSNKCCRDWRDSGACSSSICYNELRIALIGAGWR